MGAKSSEVEKCLSKLNLLLSSGQRLQDEDKKAKLELDSALRRLHAQKINGRISKEELHKNLEYELQDFFVNCESLNKNQAQILGERANLEAYLFENCQFKSSSITKYLASVLTKETKNEWLPIRYLIAQQSGNSWQKEAYGIVLSEAIFSIENITDCITLLNTPQYVPIDRFNIKYTEKNHPEITIYDEAHAKNMQNIWFLGSYNFLSISSNKNYNALYDLNDIKTKPFLHMPLSDASQKVLKKLNSEYPLYSNYSTPSLSPNHPRMIALNAINNLIDNRMNNQKYEQIVVRDR